MIVIQHTTLREIAPGWWAPARPLRGSIAANRAARARCAPVGHCWHLPTTSDPAYCCTCGRARHLLDRLMGR